MRKALIDALLDITEQDPDVFLLTGDLGYGALDEYIEKFPKQFINAGIAEQNMTSLAMGMAMDGRKVFTYSIGNFNSLRCLEQIRNDIAYHNANVTVISIGEGFAYGPAGFTHHLTEDISALRAIPNLSIFSPSDPFEAREVLKMAYQLSGPSYIRLGKGGENIVNPNGENIVYGKLNCIDKGEDLCFVTMGSIVGEVMKCKERFEEEGKKASVYTLPMIKPLDIESLVTQIRAYRYIVSVEEHTIVGGLGSIIAEILSDRSMKDCSLRRIGIQDCFVTDVGDRAYLRETAKIDARSIYEEVKRIWC